jgi:hypothetical protein
MEKQILTVNELLVLNEMMLGRGMPNQEDGIGYNKADYGACANYWNGLSDAQVADLAKRLVKYSKTQLDLDKQMMKDTAEYYAMKVTGGYDRTDGISVNITENGTLISFKYNEAFVDVIKAQPIRQYDAENKQWIVPNDRLIPVLNELCTIGADVRNALTYASNHPLLKSVAVKKEEVLTKDNGDWVLLKFKYNKNILDLIKEIDIKDRQWNPDYKFWAIKKNHLESLRNNLEDIADFKAI